MPIPIPPPFAARLGDKHLCPGADPKPHLGGAIAPVCCRSVRIDGMPAARMGDKVFCIGPPNYIAMGSMSVMIGGKPAARVGDPTVHFGKIVTGCPSVMIGG
jgi:uncharacterized Zn-binding protein involved in type VI secretion